MATTIKQKLFLEKLPKNNWNMAKTMREVGYSKQSSRSGSAYIALRKRMQDYYDPDKVKARIAKAEKDFIKDHDNNNRSRMLELQSKVSGIVKESTTPQVNIFQSVIEDLINKRVEQITQAIDTTSTSVESNTTS